MSHKTRLDAAQREWLEQQLVDALLNATPGRPRRADLADRVGALLTKAAELGDPWAQGVIESLALDGLENRAYEFLKADSTLLAFRAADGTKITRTTPSRVGVVHANGKGERYWQQGLWWELTWEEYGAFRNRERALLRSQAVKLQAFDDVDALHERHPDTRTPAEACEREGIDPRQFQIA
jgi:hypothetical protein